MYTIIRTHIEYVRIYARIFARILYKILLFLQTIYIKANVAEIVIILKNIILCFLRKLTFNILINEKLLLFYYLR